MIYLIGGGARCGKSTLAKKLLSQLPNATYLSGDSFRQSLKPVLPEFHTSGVDSSDPKKYISYYKEHTEEAIDETLKRAEALWPFILRYIEAYSHESAGDLIVESVDVWPQFVRQLAIAHTAVFLVDSDASQWHRVTEYLGENDWIRAKGLSAEQIEAWAFYNAPRGVRVIEDAERHNYASYDIARLGFDGVQKNALAELLTQRNS